MADGDSPQVGYLRRQLARLVGKNRFINWGICWGGVLLIVGVLLTYFFETKASSLYIALYLIGLLFTEAGVAVVIAVIIGITLDEYSKDEIRGIISDGIARFEDKARSGLNEFKDNSFNALFKMLIPEEYVEEVRQQIFKNSHIKTRVSIDYTLSELQGNALEEFKAKYPKLSHRVEDRIGVVCKTEYVLKNIGGGDSCYSVPFYIEKEDAPLFNILTELTIQQGISIIARYDNNPPYDNIIHYDINSFLIDEGDDFCNVYKFREVHIPSMGEIEVVATSRYTRSAKNNREIWGTLLLAKSVKICVRDMTNSFDSECFPLARGRYTKPAGECCWNINTPLLPYQGFVLWWNKRPKEKSTEQIPDRPQ